MRAPRKCPPSRTVPEFTRWTTVAITSSSLSMHPLTAGSKQRGLRLHASYLPERPCLSLLARTMAARPMGRSGRDGRVQASDPPDGPRAARRDGPPGRLIRMLRIARQLYGRPRPPAGRARSARRRRRPSTRDRRRAEPGDGALATISRSSRARSAWRRTSASRFPRLPVGHVSQRAAARPGVRPAGAPGDGLAPAGFIWTTLRVDPRVPARCRRVRQLRARRAHRRLSSDRSLVYRPQWIARWEAGADEVAGGALARARRAHRRAASCPGPGCRAQRARPPAGGGDAPASRGGLRHPDPSAPAYLHGFRGSAERVDVHLFLLAPCREYWGAWRGRATRAGGVTAARPTPGAALLGTLSGQDFLDLVIDCDPHVDEPASASRETTASCTRSRPTCSRCACATAGSPSPDDRSIQVHVPARPHAPWSRCSTTTCCGCSSSTRTLTPDVVVMTPDIDAYAPPSRRCSAAQRPRRRMPFTIADRSLRADAARSSRRSSACSICPTAATTPIAS